MNFEYFIASRIIKSQGFKDSVNQKGTRPIIKIATLSIALGLAIMVLAVGIVTGFQNEIRSKVIGFGSHITIQQLGGSLFETSPINTNQPFYPSLDTVEGVRHIQKFGLKGGIIKTGEEVYGVMLKGIASDYDWTFFQKNIIEGKSLSISDSVRTDEVLISKTISEKLKLKTGDSFRMFFIQEPVRQRKFIVRGIYSSGMEQLDKLYILGDIKHIQSLNNWSDTLVGGFEVLLDNYKSLERMDEYIYSYIPLNLSSAKITDQFKEIFGWLELLDMNVWVILIFSILVAGINMITALLILILERTQMIGLLKALGANNAEIRKIFLYNAAFLIGKGLLWGNLIGISLGIIQKYTGIITLPEETYYIHIVPVNLDILNIILLNLGTFLLCMLMLVLPSYVVTRISPVKAIRFN